MSQVNSLPTTRRRTAFKVKLFSIVRRETVVPLLLLTAFVSVVIAVRQMMFPFENHYGESVVMLGAERFLHGGLAALYPTVTSTNAVPAVYPPLYYVVVALLMKLGVPAYPAGRGISLVCAFGVCFIIYKAVHRETRDRWIAVGAAATFIFLPDVNYRLTEMKCDLLGLLFVMLGVYKTIYYDRTRVFSLALLFSLGVLTKHYYVVAPVVAFVILFRRNRKRAVQFMGLTAVLLASSFTVLELATHGRFFTEIIFGVKGSISLKDITHILVQMSQPWLVFASVGIWSCMLVWRNGNRNWVSYLMATFCFAVYAIGKDGAASDYFYECFAVLPIVMGVAIHHVRESKKSSAFNLVTVLVLAQIVVSVPNMAYNVKSVIHQTMVTSTDKIEAIVDASPSGALSDIPGLIVDSHKPLAIAPFEYKLFVANHIVSDAELVNEMENGNYDVVIASPLYTERFTPDVLSTIQSDYSNIGTVDDMSVYLFKGMSPTKSDVLEHMVRIDQPKSNYP